MIDQVLSEREKTHGDFSEVAKFAQEFKTAFIASENYRLKTVSSLQRESLDMIASKLARILCGNPDEPDHWLDIAGYALLVANNLKEQG
jgi:hypothetical protein